MLNCNSNMNDDKQRTKNIIETTEFLSALKVTALDLNKNGVELNIGYSIIFESITLNKCRLNCKEEVNDYILMPAIRSVIRSEISNITKDDINLINKENLKAKINEQINSGRIVIDGKKLNNCDFSIGLLSITKR